MYNFSPHFLFMCISIDDNNINIIIVYVEYEIHIVEYNEIDEWENC